MERFNPDGNRDTSFGSGGIVVTNFGEPSSAHALVLQADGRLVAAGAFGTLPAAPSNPGRVLARYHSDGSLDTSFGTGGLVVTNAGDSTGGWAGLAVQADGRLVAGGGGRRATILGTSDNDILRGTSGPDVILGRGGNDTIRGLAGNDMICGGAGRDTLIGGDGKDRLLGEDGDDRLFGDKGRDRLDGGSGRDACRTGERPRRCEGKPASSKPTSGERPKDPPKATCPAVSNFPCS